MLDESRRDDIGWLVATYDQLVEQASSEQRERDLALVQRWLCRVTGLPTVSAAIAAARRLTHHEITFLAPVVPPQPAVSRSRRTDTAGALPPLNDETAAELEKLLAELDSYPRRRPLTAAEQAQADRGRRRIRELTGFTRITAARSALRTYLTRRDGAHKFIPTKSYAQGPGRRPPRITIVGGGAPGSGGRH